MSDEMTPVWWCASCVDFFDEEDLQQVQPDGHYTCPICTADVVDATKRIKDNLGGLRAAVKTFGGDLIRRGVHPNSLRSWVDHELDVLFDA